MTQHLKDLNTQITQCEKCPRLITHCRKTAKEKRRAYINENYWGKPVAGFGDPNARLLIVGLAPAAHGANRTGRVFTGDQSGRWLYRALHRYGFSNQPSWENAHDGLILRDTWITCVVKCAPPENKPDRIEIQNCQAHLISELQFLKKIRVIIALGQIATRQVQQIFDGLEPVNCSKNSQRFKHGQVWSNASHDGKILIASYHPSQQNTFTGKLTEPMFDSIFEKARGYLDVTPGK